MPIFWRIVVSALLLAVLLYQVDWGEANRAIGNIRWGWLIAAITAFNVSMVLAAYRWRLIVLGGRKDGADVGMRKSVTATYASLWLSNFLPTAFGGDVARVFAARSSGAAWSWAISSTVMDRMLGLFALALIFLLSEALLSIIGKPGIWLMPAAVLAGVFAVAFLALAGSAAVRIPRTWLRSRHARSAVRSIRALRILLADRALVFPILMASMAASGFGILAYWGALSGVSPGMPLSTAVAAAALGTIASAVPISLSGWGIREGTVAAVLSQAGGLSVTDAGIAALLNGLVIGATSTIGMFASTRLRWSAAADTRHMFKSR